MVMHINASSVRSVGTVPPSQQPSKTHCVCLFDVVKARPKHNGYLAVPIFPRNLLTWLRGAHLQMTSRSMSRRFADEKIDEKRLLYRLYDMDSRERTEDVDKKFGAVEIDKLKTIMVVKTS